jgi:CRISPR-associated protein Csd2
MPLVSLPNQEIITDPSRRHVFTYLFDVMMGNPNGDPRHPSNYPRQETRSRRGYVTDGAQKRWIRDTAERLYEGRDHYQIFVRSKGQPLNAILRQIDENLRGGTVREETGGGGTATLVKPAKQERVVADMRARRDAVVDAYWDTRMFGQVMGTGRFPAESVKGPIQIVAAKSVHAVEVVDMQITRVVPTREEDVEERGKLTEFGSKPIILYGLYQAFGFYNTPYARSSEEGGTGVTREDLVLLWSSIQSMFELLRSAAKGMMSFRGLYIFSEQSQFGNEHAHKLFGRVHTDLKDGVTRPGGWEDYRVWADREGLPETITLTVIE